MSQQYITIHKSVLMKGLLYAAGWKILWLGGVAGQGTRQISLVNVMLNFFISLKY